MAYKTPKDVQERKDSNKRQILDAAAGVFARRGYHSTAVKDIVDEAGMSVGSFYFYFRNKEDLFETLYGEMSGMLFNTLECSKLNAEIGTPRSIARSITSFLAEVQKNRELARIMMIEAVGLNPGFEKKRTEATRLFSDKVEYMLQSLYENSELGIKDIKVIATAFIGTFYNVVSSWLEEGNDSYLTDCAYPLTVFNLQALKIRFDYNDIKKYILEVLNEKNIV